MKHVFYSAVVGLSALAFSAGAMAQDASQGNQDTLTQGQTMQGNEAQRTSDQGANPQTDSGIVLSQASVTDMQRALQTEGYSVSVDGVWGPSTAKAVSDFQEDNQLPVTGEPDNQTLAALNIDSHMRR